MEPARVTRQRVEPVVPYPFDFRAPDYTKVYQWRAQFLHKIRSQGATDRLIAFYRVNPIQFIIDWAVTFDPRNVEIGLPSKIPFVPFPRQIQWLQWTLERWSCRERGLCEKSRGEGVSWLAVTLAATLCLFNRGIVIGFGSRKAEYVDQIGDPKALFFKARMFLESLPPEFRFGWNSSDHSRHMRILFPTTESAITGESGDSIGRGDRTSIYFVDEAAFLEHPDLAESSLSDTTNCRIDISTPNGINNAFYERREALPERQIFTLHFRDDPRRDAAWEAKKRSEIAPQIFNAEYDCSYESGGAFFTENSLLVAHKDAVGNTVYKPVEDPTGVDCVVGIVDTAVKTNKEHDGLAITFNAVQRRSPYPLIILDYDYTQIEGASLPIWLPTAFERLEVFAKLCGARMGSIGVFVEDKVSGSVLLQFAKNNGLQARPIDSKLTALGKVERAINISGYIHQGKVKLSRRAYERTVNFKGVTKNHLLAQILGFRPAVQDGRQDDLLDCFTYSAALALGNREGF
jgi:hypothetical protein